MKLNWEINLLEVTTLVFSLIALIVALKNRKNVLRENLYNRQLDVFQSIFIKVTQLEGHLNHLSALEKMAEDHENEIDYTEDLDELEDEIILITEELEDELYQARIIIPDEMAEKFEKFLSYFNSVDILLENEKANEINLEDLSDKIADLEEAIRDFIGLEKLTRANRQVI